MLSYYYMNSAVYRVPLINLCWLRRRWMGGICRLNCNEWGEKAYLIGIDSSLVGNLSGLIPWQINAWRCLCSCFHQGHGLTSQITFVLWITSPVRPFMSLAPQISRSDPSAITLSALNPQIPLSALFLALYCPLEKMPKLRAYSIFKLRYTKQHIPVTATSLPQCGCLFWELSLCNTFVL